MPNFRKRRINPGDLESSILIGKIKHLFSKTGSLSKVAKLLKFPTSFIKRIIVENKVELPSPEPESSLLEQAAKKMCEETELPFAEIARRLGKPTSLITSWCSGIEREAKFGRPVIDPETKKKAVSLYEDGCSAIDVSILTGIPYATIRRWCEGVSRKSNTKNCLEKRSIFSEGEKEEILKLSKIMSLEKLAIRFKTNISNIKKIVGKKAPPTKGPGRKPPWSLKAKAIELCRQGMPFIQIEKKLGINRATISKWWEKAQTQLGIISPAIEQLLDITTRCLYIELQNNASNTGRWYNLQPAISKIIFDKLVRIGLKEEGVPAQKSSLACKKFTLSKKGRPKLAQKCTTCGVSWLEHGKTRKIKNEILIETIAVSKAKQKEKNIFRFIYFDTVMYKDSKLLSFDKLKNKIHSFYKKNGHLKGLRLASNQEYLHMTYSEEQFDLALNSMTFKNEKFLEIYLNFLNTIDITSLQDAIQTMEEMPEELMFLSQSYAKSKNKKLIETKLKAAVANFENSDSDYFSFEEHIKDYLNL